MKDAFFSTLTAIGAGVTSTLLGGWDKSLEILSIFIIMDYVTGVAAAFKAKTLKSSIGLEHFVHGVDLLLDCQHQHLDVDNPEAQIPSQN
jgi:phage-related holin